MDTTNPQSRIQNLKFFFSTLPKNPIYRRERGDWGNPNTFYSTLMRYSPLIIIGVVVFGLCGITNNLSFAGASDDLFLIYCLICFPNVGLNMVTLYGNVMAPALTAPAVNQEQVAGSWDMLLITPQSNRAILGAKLLGAMARLKIWWSLVIMSLLNGFLSVFIVITALVNDHSIASMLTVPSAIVRPFVEVFFAGVFGLLMSTLIRSATTALAVAYAGIFLTRIFNNTLLWGNIARIFLDETTAIWIGSAFVPTIYTLLIAGCLFWLNHQANNMT